MTELNFGDMPVKAFQMILEFMDFSDMTPQQILSLRLVSRSVDECMYDMWLRKSSQLFEQEQKLQKLKFEYNPEGLEKQYF